MSALPSTAPDLQPASESAAQQARRAAEPLATAILLTVLYSDLFDYPLTREEIRRFRIRAPGTDPARSSIDDSIQSLIDGQRLTEVDGYVCWPGREDTARLRRTRAASAEPMWTAARSWGNRLASLPFVRMVAVCGSLAMNNTGDDGDIDLFCITDRKRLWLVHLGAMLMRRAARLKGVRLCPNYLLTVDTLAVERRDLYTAREVAQAVPIAGLDVYRQFVAANRWVERFLPHVELQAGDHPASSATTSATSSSSPHGWLSRTVERLLGGRLGDAIDRSLHRCLTAYYGLRWRRHGLTTEQVRKAYQRHRQQVVERGYAAPVLQAFNSSVRRQLGDDIADRWLGSLTGSGDPKAAGDGSQAEIFDQQLQQHYGAGHG